MLHPMLQVIMARPALLAGHLSAYGDLLADEVGAAAIAWRRQALLTLAAVALMLMALTLAGVAVMLQVVLAVPLSTSTWALLLVPAVPALAAVACVQAARRHTPAPAFATLRQQWQADLLVLRDAGVAR